MINQRQAHHAPAVRRYGRWILLTAATLAYPATAQDKPAPTPAPAKVATGQPAAGQPTAPSTTRSPVTRQDLNQALIVFDELNEQIQIAAAKLDPQSLARKEQIGKLRSLLRATDEQIQLQSTAIGRLEERFRHLRQDLSGAVVGQGGDVSPDAAALLEKSRTPIEEAKARLERLANYRVRTRQQLSSLQRDHVQALLAAIVTPAEPTSSADDFEQLLETSLNEPAH